MTVCVMHRHQRCSRYKHCFFCFSFFLFFWLLVVDLLLKEPSDKPAGRTSMPLKIFLFYCMTAAAFVMMFHKKPPSFILAEDSHEKRQVSYETKWDFR